MSTVVFSAALTAYCTNPFDPAALPPAPVLPQADEPHVTVWCAYRDEAGADVFGFLRERLPQLCVPIREGIATSEEYAAVLRRGEPFSEEAFGGRLRLSRPEALQLRIALHPAGALPVLSTSYRDDFVALCRALAYRSAPEPVGPMVNAQMIAGLLNWDRVRRYQAEWSAARGFDAAEAWPGELQRVAREERWRFFDRLILQCEGPYAGLSARDLGLAADEGEGAWIARSATLRTEHELAHYATKRLYGCMRLNLFDELIADTMGMISALGAFRAEWFLACLGADASGAWRDGARATTYRQDLDDADFGVALRMAARAASAVEAFTARVVLDPARLLLTLTGVSLAQLADTGAPDALEASWTRAGARMARG